MNLLFGVPPIGVMTMLLNIPLLLIVWRVYGFRFIIKTAVATFAVSLGMDLCRFWPVEELTPLLCAVFGGITTGVAMGLLFSRGYNTGGTDLIVYLLRRKWKRLSPGGIIFSIDCFIIAFSAFALHSTTLVFYSMITIYVQTKALDLVVNGFHRGSAAFIISEKEKEIAKASPRIWSGASRCFRGGDISPASSGRCFFAAVPSGEVYKLKKLVKKYDPDAFLIITDAAEISGFGFEESSV